MGHTISAAGIAPTVQRVDSICRFPLPKTQKELRGFLGMVNFYNKFIPKAAEIMGPLYSLLKPSRRGSPTNVAWDDAAKAAFRQTKRALADATLLCHPVPFAKLRITTDASARLLFAQV